MCNRSILFGALFLAVVCGAIAQPNFPVYRLGVLAEGITVDSACSRLSAAGATVINVSDGSVLFALKRKIDTAQFQNVASLFKDVISNPAIALREPAISGNPIVKEFARYFFNKPHSPVVLDLSGESPDKLPVNIQDLVTIGSQNRPDDSVSGIDAVLADGGIIAGKATNAAGAPVKCLVQVYNAAATFISGPIDITMNEDDGSYSVPGLPTGNYKVYFHVLSGNYLNQWYRNKDTFDTASQVSVTVGNTSNADVVLAPGGIISGKVTNAAGAGQKSVSVRVYDAAKPASEGSVGSGSTDLSGNYSVSALPTGNYKVYFFPVMVDYLPQWYSGAGTFDGANQVGVAAGSTTPNINAVLSPGGSISGRVTNAAGTPMIGTYVQVFDASQSYAWINYVKMTFITSTDGSYSVGGLQSGTYKVFFQPMSGNYAPEWYNNKTNFDASTAVSVTVGSNTPNINAVLDPGGIIKGTVTNESGTPLKDVVAYAIDTTTGYWPFMLIASSTGYTATNGTYSIGNLPAGNYWVNFVPTSGNYLPQWYDNKQHLERSNPVAVAAGQTVSNINAILHPGNTISGRVTNQSGVGITDAEGTAYIHDGIGEFSGDTDQNGDYEILSLPGGAYRVRFDPKANNYISEWYNDKKDFQSANIIYLGNYITITAPIGLEQWPLGSTQNITWISRNISGTVNIDLFKAGKFVSAIGTAGVSAGSYAWQIPQSLQPGTDYKIGIYQGNIEDFSNSPFALTNGTGSWLRITSPNGGEQWQRGTTYSITWTQSGLTGNVTLQLYKGGVLSNTLGSAAATAGTYSWTVPGDQAAGTDYKVRVSQGSLEDYSDSNFSIAAGGTLPGKAMLISPNGTITTNTPTYVWGAVAGSTWYYLWVNDSATQKKVLQWYTAADCGCASGTGNCSITPATALAMGQATFWIQTYNAAGNGPWSDGLTFTVAQGSLPGKATLVSPSGTITTNTPTYIWKAVAGSTWYYLWVNDSATQKKVLQWYTAADCGCASGTGNCSITPATALATGQATFWIQTYNAAGNGPWSDSLIFTVTQGSLPGKATLISPNGTIATNKPTYVWGAVAGSTWYYLWVNDSATTKKILQWYTAADCGCGLGAGNCSITPATSLAMGQATFWIQTYNAAGNGPWSDGMVFNVSQGGPPGKATLISPNGTITIDTPTYIWNAVSGATSYYLCVDDGETIQRILRWYTAEEAGCASGTGACSLTPDIPLAYGEAQFWIQTHNAAGYGPWSDGLTFTVMVEGPPGAATLVSPNGTVTTTMPTYIWNAVSGASWYYLCVDDNETIAKILIWYSAAEAGCSSGTGTCSIKPESALAQGDAQFWIQTYNSKGPGPWSDGMMFHVSAAAPGILGNVIPIGARPGGVY